MHTPPVGTELVDLCDIDYLKTGRSHHVLDLGSVETANMACRLVGGTEELRPRRNLDEDVPTSLDVLQPIEGRRRVVLLFSDGEDTAVAGPCART